MHVATDGNETSNKSIRTWCSRDDTIITDYGIRTLEVTRRVPVVILFEITCQAHLSAQVETCLGAVDGPIASEKLIVPL